jgi:hypothetical protein
MANYIIINSVDRTSGTSSDFIINSSNLIRLNGRNKLKLKSIVMYNTIYTINGNNNKIDFNENSTNKTTTLTNGWYTASSLATHIGTAMTTTSGGFATFTASYSSVTGKMTISSTQNFSLLFLTGTNTSSSPYRELGFTSTNGITAVNTSAGTSATGNNIVNLGLPLTIYISINNWNGSNIKDTSGTHCTFAVPVNCLAGEMINFNGDDIEQVVEVPSNVNVISQLKITLSSVNNRAIDLNNSEWSLILEILS